MKGSVIGLNEQIMCDFMDYTAFYALREIGIKYEIQTPKSHPLPWFLKHTDPSKKQTALQESESTNYVVGAVSEEIDYDALPDL
jgi:ribonucleoside-diphosphate reductase beta chain